MTEIHIHFEGTDTLRQPFSQFFSPLREFARQKNAKLRLLPANDGPRDFKKALRSNPEAVNILLKDSEQPIANPVELCKIIGVDPVLVDKVFWMVRLMEAWFLADPEALANYYGQGFLHKVIGQTTNVETIQKSEVIRRLKSATTNTKKGEYDKIRHAPRILERLDPALVQERAPNCRRFFEYVRSILSG